jgi:hypothetical protein
MNKALLLSLIGLVTICCVSFGATNQSSPQQISYQCFIIESDKPIPHDFSKLSHRDGTFIESAPAVMGNVDQQMAVKIVTELFPEYVKGQKYPERIEPGISISLRGTPYQNKIILIGKLRVLNVISRSTNPESTSIATIAKELYFSKIVESGKEAWFDLDCPDQKPKCLAVRIVPTLVLAKP